MGPPRTTRDGRWVLVHGGFPHLHQGILDLLGVSSDDPVPTREVGEAIAEWTAQDLEDAIAEQRLCGAMVRSEPDDDINYTVLALQLLEAHGTALTTVDVARAWLRDLPVGWTFTAERAAFKVLLAEGHEYFALGAEPGFDLALCSENEWNEITPGDRRYLREFADRHGYGYSTESKIDMPALKAA